MRNELGNALASYLDKELAFYEKEMQKKEEYIFSEKFVEEMKSFTQMKKHQNMSVPRRRKLIIALVAIIAMVISSVTVIAASQKHIEYVLKEYDGNCEVTFESVTFQTGTIDYFKPKVPSDYVITDESDEGNLYYIDYTNGKEDIHYQQIIPEGTCLVFDITQSDVRRIRIHGRDALVFHENDYYTILVEDGKYAYSVMGNCKYEDLYAIAKDCLN